MARSVNEIQQSITTMYVAEMAAIGKTVTPAAWSQVNMIRLLIFIFASAAFVLESLFDLLRSEVDTTIRDLKPHSERWYAGKAKVYQHGFDLLPDSDQYDNTGYTDADIAAAKIVKYSAVVEQTNQFGRVYLRIKLATESGQDLAPLSEPQLDGVKEYFKRIKDAGVGLQIDSLPADNLKMTWTVYYDPLILDSTGGRLDGTDSEPVPSAIRTYLKNLPFNGLFVLAYITDAIQQVEGVVIPQIESASTKYGDTEYVSVNVKYNPDAGYLRFYDTADLIINYIPQSAIQ